MLKNIPWYLLRDIRRWLGTFNVKLASEGTTRKLASEWIGKGLQTELAAITVVKNKKSSVIQKHWFCLYNLVRHVLKRLQDM